jgi:aryl-alcohol dehydrogenase-like predicted oxidoreductase
MTFHSVLPPAGLQVSSLGLGAWSWGDRSRYWQDSINKEENITVRQAG